MKKTSLLIGSLLLVSACATSHGSSVVSGNLRIVNEYGYDMTKYCGKVVKSSGAFAKNAEVGTFSIGQITCINNYDVYKIKGDRLTVNVPKENSQVNFGNVTITLNDDKDASFKVTGGNGNLKVGEKSHAWSKVKRSTLGRW